MPKKEILRMCVSCREKKDRKNLLRICNVNGEILVDKEHKLEGRGAYVCSKECLINSKKGDRLKRALRHDINYDTLELILKEFYEG